MPVSSSCLMDSKSPDSSSSFTRPALNKLRFDITAFKFQGDSRSMMYMTCTLRAVNADKPADASNKACSYQKQSYRWVSEDGSSAVCGCCDTGSCSGTPRFLTGPLPPAEINQPNWRGKLLPKRAAPLDPAGQDPRVHVKEITIGPLTVVHVVRDHAVVLSKESLYHPLQLVEEVQDSAISTLFSSLTSRPAHPSPPTLDLLCSAHQEPNCDLLKRTKLPAALDLYRSLLC
ncbi:UNVERIFIED_CONTAM: hypothetical protein FKN15_077749 [Acipenser sinensis]